MVLPVWEREGDSEREGGREGGMQRGNVLSIYISLKTLASNGRSRDLHI
jgi:hypothetical protein